MNKQTDQYIPKTSEQTELNNNKKISSFITIKYHNSFITIKYIPQKSE